MPSFADAHFVGAGMSTVPSTDNLRPNEIARDLRKCASNFGGETAELMRTAASLISQQMFGCERAVCADVLDENCQCGKLAREVLALAAPSAPPRVIPDTFEQHTPDADGWAQWTAPVHDSYLIKCCDCGLVHEMQFQVVPLLRHLNAEEWEAGEPSEQHRVLFRARRALETKAAAPEGVAVNMTSSRSEAEQPK